jgi:hypothetical protein
MGLDLKGTGVQLCIIQWEKLLFRSSPPNRYTYHHQSKGILQTVYQVKENLSKGRRKTDEIANFGGKEEGRKPDAVVGRVN